MQETVHAHHVGVQHHELARLVLKLGRAIPLPPPPVTAMTLLKLNHQHMTSSPRPTCGTDQNDRAPAVHRAQWGHW